MRKEGSWRRELHAESDPCDREMRKADLRKKNCTLSPFRMKRDARGGLAADRGDCGFYPPDGECRGRLCGGVNRIMEELIILSGEVRIIRISPFFNRKVLRFKASDENAQSAPVHIGQL